MSRGYVWVVDDDSSIRWVMEKTLSSANIKCETFADAESVLFALERETPDVLVSDIRMPGMDGIALLNQVHEHIPEPPGDHYDRTFRSGCRGQRLPTRCVRVSSQTF